MAVVILASSTVELDRPEQVAMVGHGNGFLSERAQPLEQRVVLDGAVEERVLGVEMKMRERNSGHQRSSLASSRLDEVSFMNETLAISGVRSRRPASMRCRS
jgi:hypothetical protein